MRLFFELLQVAMGNRQELSHTPDAGEWQEMYDIASKQTIAGICADGIGMLPKEQQPPKDIAMRWAMTAVCIEKQNRRLNSQAVKIQEKFRNAGFRSCIFKGQGIAAAYYPKPLHRQCGDIDIWLEGSRKRIISYVRSISPNETVSYHHIDFKILKDPSVEIHFFPSYLNNPFRNRRLLAYWREETARQMENRITLPGDAGTITAPTDDFNLIAILAHIQHHYFEEGIGLRQLADYYHILASGIDEDIKADVRRKLKAFGMMKFAGAVMYVLQKVFGMKDDSLLLPPQEKAGKLLLTHVMESGNFGKYDKKVSRIYQSGTPLSRFIRRERFNLRIFMQYPEEYFSEIYFRVFYYFYRKRWNGR